ncbi:MAG: hypothetical protein WBH76_07295 [Dictyoglomaceae bacterium]
MENPFLVGDRIYFRPLELEDLPKLIRWVNDLEVTAFLTMGTFPFNTLREEEWLKSLYKSQSDVVSRACCI